METSRFRKYLIVAILVAGAFLAGKKFFFYVPASLPDPFLIEPMHDISLVPTVYIGETKILVLIAEGSAALEKGLSGKPSLDAHAGMLFVFPKADPYQFWMPNMPFPIDIIWIQDGKVVGVEADVSNIFNPKNPRFYTPPEPVQYVLEVNAGFAKANHVSMGDAVRFKNIK